MCEWVMVSISCCCWIRGGGEGGGMVCIACCCWWLVVVVVGVMESVVSRAHGYINITLQRTDGRTGSGRGPGSRRAPGGAASGRCGTRWGGRAGAAPVVFCVFLRVLWSVVVEALL